MQGASALLQAAGTRRVRLEATYPLLFFPFFWAHSSSTHTPFLRGPICVPSKKKEEKPHPLARSVVACSARARARSSLCFLTS